MGGGHSGSDQRKWRVRVCDAQGAVLGAGLLLGTRHVLTCAHVLLRAEDLGAEDSAPTSGAPTIEVVIDFVGLHPMRSARAWVADGGWISPNDTNGGDIALLELEEPQHRGSITPLRRIAVTLGLTVSTCGFPRGNTDGVWLGATLAGNGGPGIECVQMDPIWPGGPVRPGFSGAPVFNEMTNVIGMVVSRYSDSEFGFSYMLPVEAIIRHLPRIKQWVEGTTSSDSSLVESIGSQAIDERLAREIVSWIERRGDIDNTLIIVTGDPDSPASGTMRSVISLADREQRPDSTDPLVAKAPEGTVPPAGSIHLAIDASGKTPGKVLGRIVDRTGIPMEQSTEPTAELLDSPPPMTIAVYGIDDSEKPVMLVTDVLEPLAKRGHRLLLAFRREFSPSLSIARSSLKMWNCAGLVSLPVLDLPNPSDKVRDNSVFREPPKLTTGDLVANQYEIVGCLARGGVGWVYLARDTHLDGNYVALKELTKDAGAVTMSVTERRLLTAIDHPNIVRIFNFVTHREANSGERTGYIVMEYVGGQSLGEIADAAERGEPSNIPLPVDHILAYGIEILAAFDYLHSHGLLYCDMSPNNVIRSANRIKVIDLGAVRGIRDRWSRTARNERFQVGEQERESGLTVQSDLYAVGKTLEYLLDVSADVYKNDTKQGNSPVSFGVESFRRLLERATHEEVGRRFPSAAAMSQQLRGVLREVLSLRDGEERPEPSTVFADTAALLDAGLGMVPPLDNWTANRAIERDAPLGDPLGDGRPGAFGVAVGLPTPQPGAENPAPATVSATNRHDSIAMQLRTCRAHLELGELKEAGKWLDRAEGILRGNAGHDWRIAWHHGLLALARDRTADAEPWFVEVYRALPGEDAPKLALGFCYEPHRRDDAARFYHAVWQRDRLQASAAFGLARISLRRGNRKDAVAILDEVPDISRHYDAARVAAVRILCGRITGTSNKNDLPTGADLKMAISRLNGLDLDGGDDNGPARDRLRAAVQEAALAWVRETGGDGQLDGHDVLGNPVSERGLRKRLERSFRALARQAPNANDHSILIDLANAVRPRTAW